MYIEKYWPDRIGGTDDCLTLLEYLAAKAEEKDELPLSEIFADIGLDMLQGDFRSPELPLCWTTPEGWEADFQYAIDLVAQLAALLLECKVSGRVSLGDLQWGPKDGKTSGPSIRITAAPEEHALIDRALRDFAAAPLEYDLSEMEDEEDMLALAAACAEVREELYG